MNFFYNAAGVKRDQSSTYKKSWRAKHFVACITNPDVPADCFDAFDSEEDAPDLIEDEHHAILEWSIYATTGQMFSDRFPSHVSTVSQLLNQPDCNRLAKFLTCIRMLRLNTA